MHVSAELGARGEQLTLPVDDDQLLVVRKPLLDRRDIVVEPSARRTAARRPPSGLDVLGHFVGTREDPDVVKALFEPEVELACGLRTHAPQLFGDLVPQGGAVLGVRNPGHPQGGDQRRQQGEPHDLALDAL